MTFSLHYFSVSCNGLLILGTYLSDARRRAIIVSLYDFNCCANASNFFSSHMVLNASAKLLHMIGLESGLPTSFTMASRMLSATSSHLRQSSNIFRSHAESWTALRTAYVWPMPSRAFSCFSRNFVVRNPESFAAWRTAYACSKPSGAVSWNRFRSRNFVAKDF